MMRSRKGLEVINQVRVSQTSDVWDDHRELWLDRIDGPNLLHREVTTAIQPVLITVISRIAP